MHTFSDNSRAIYEAALRWPGITKIILTREKSLDIPPHADTIVIPMRSLAAITYILRAKVIIIQHSVWLDLAPLRVHGNFFFNFASRILFNTWHGIPIKSLASNSSGINIRPIQREKKYYQMPASSRIDQLAMTVSFYPIPPKSVHVTGAPRNDFLMVAESALPVYCKAQINYIRSLVQTKTLIIYAPTYREIELGGRYYNFSAQEEATLKELLRSNDAILGMRLHYYNRPASYNNMIDDELIFDMSQEYIPDMAMLIREAHVIITDYSGLFVDTLYLNRPVVTFAYDLEHYRSTQRGLMYDLPKISPLPVCESFQELIKVLRTLISGPNVINSLGYKHAQGVFFDFVDSKNGERAVKCINKLCH